MKTLFIFVIIVLGLMAGYHWLTQNSDALPADPVTAVTTEGIRSKVHAEVSMTIINLRQRMQRSLAAPESNEVTAIKTASAALHTLVTTTQKQLSTLGDSETAINSWLNSIQWNQFLEDEQAFNTSAPAQ